VPGFALSSSISSRMLEAGTDGCTEIVSGAEATNPTGKKLLSGSNDVHDGQREGGV